ncbi:MAG: hypothetical protein ACLU37_03835 [Collinsella sp.]
MTPLSPRARSSCLPRRSNPRKSPARPSPRSKSEGTKTTKTVAVAATGAKTTGKLAATGDASSASSWHPPLREQPTPQAPW